MMHNKTDPVGLLSRSMTAVTCAQFFSAFGDNALLFVTLAILSQYAYPEWSQPVLQMVFVATYIILAPFVGQFADSFPKGRVMMFANGMKLFGALAICFHLDPFIGYGMVGIGAAAYSPAKYGILGEITRGETLVKANGLMESSTIVAILLGSIGGGLLADWDLHVAPFICVLAYGLAVLANMLIPSLHAARPGQPWNPLRMASTFFTSCGTLWRDIDTRFSLIGTSLFWGAGATLRILMVIWVPAALGINDHKTPTLLNAMVAVGIIFGAAAAAKLVTLKTVTRCLPAGMLIGVAVVLFSLQHMPAGACGLLIVIGALGGFFVVPLNALLQMRGKESVGSGSAIAVQNLGENGAMLLMLGLYTLAVSLGIPPAPVGVGFGVLFTTALALLWCGYVKQLRKQQK